MISAFITNLGKYNEGELCGEYLNLPATTEDVKALLSRIGVDGVIYEEIFITDYETKINGLNNLGEYENIGELNYLASLLADMDKYDLERFEAAAAFDDNNYSVKNLINLTQNLDNFDFYPDVHDYDDLGRYLIYECGFINLSDQVEPYFDYQAYGRDFADSETCKFINGGFMWQCYNEFEEFYDGYDIPDEYRIFSYPDPVEKMPMKQQLDMFSKMAAVHSETSKLAPSHEDRI